MNSTNTCGYFLKMAMAKIHDEYLPILGATSVELFENKDYSIYIILICKKYSLINRIKIDKVASSVGYVDKIYRCVNKLYCVMKNSVINKNSKFKLYVNREKAYL